MLTWFLRWVLGTVANAAEAELNDDTALRERLLEAEMQREMGDISDQEYKDIETELLARIREIRKRREGSGPLSSGQPIETTGGSSYRVEASVSGDFHDPGDRPHTTVIEDNPPRHALLNLVETEADQQERVLDVRPEAPRPARARRQPRTSRPRRRRAR